MDHFNCILRPTPKQTSLLQRLFSGPQTLLNIVTENSRLDEPLDSASLLLMKNKEHLDQFLNSQDRRSSYELLLELAKVWMHELPRSIEIWMPGKSTISVEGKIFLPVASMGLVDVRDAERLLSLKHSHMLSDEMSLHEGNGLFYVRISSNGERPISRQVPRRAKNDKQAAAISGQPLRSDDHSKSRRGHTKSLRAISATLPSSKRKSFLSFAKLMQAFPNCVDIHIPNSRQEGTAIAMRSTWDMDALSGRPVSAGLPSLGKRSR